MAPLTSNDQGWGQGGGRGGDAPLGTAQVLLGNYTICQKMPEGRNVSHSALRTSNQLSTIRS